MDSRHRAVAKILEGFNALEPLGALHFEHHPQLGPVFYLEVAGRRAFTIYYDPERCDGIGWDIDLPIPEIRFE